MKCSALRDADMGENYEENKGNYNHKASIINATKMKGYYFDQLR